MIKSDFHTHTLFCDGKETVDIMAKAAYTKGMDALGFSGHSHTPFDESYCMSTEATANYIEAVKRIRREYDGRFEIYLGIERDLYSDIQDLHIFDYVISSVHYVFKNGKYLPVDESEKIFVNNVKQYYGGDYMAFCEDYYKAVVKACSVNGSDILGHIDLVTKFNEGNKLFDTSDERYTYAVDEVLDVAAAKDKIIEINTGAIYRGYRSVPYPSFDILKKWNLLGGRIIFSGDAHDTEGLCYKFDEAERLAKDAGFETAIVFDDGELTEVEL